MSDPDEILTIKQVADYLKVNERAIYKLAQEGGIPTVKVANQWRFRRSMIDGWLDLLGSIPSIGVFQVGALLRLHGIGLRGAQPGEYELVLTVQDDLAGQSVEVREPFEIVGT